MHVLVTNDDGPPSEQASPYLLPFVRSLEDAGHTVSVIVPDTQRSWIGKAHMIGKDVRAIPYWPPTTTPPVHDPNSPTSSSSSSSAYPWVLVDATPAGAAQIGLDFFFADRGPVDVVVSGPNYGRNTSAVFALSSGTLGAALEAAVCGRRAIALSFAFTDRLNKPEIVAQSCRQGVRVVEWLMRNAPWGDARLYTVNIPVKDGVERARVVWTRILQNEWSPRACFEELSGDVMDGENGSLSQRDPNLEEAKIRQQRDGKHDGAAVANEQRPWHERRFKWQPKFSAVYDSVQRAGPGSDGWVVKEGETSITPIRANFMHVDGFEGEVKL